MERKPLGGLGEKCVMDSDEDFTEDRGCIEGLECYTSDARSSFGTCKLHKTEPSENSIPISLDLTVNVL